MSTIDPMVEERMVREKVAEAVADAMLGQSLNINGVGYPVTHAVRHGSLVQVRVKAPVGVYYVTVKASIPR